MKEIIIETLTDSIKLFPFLFLTFLLMEFIEHKLTSKNKKILQKSGKFGPLIGSILGLFPQCGFSAAASNLYAVRIISMGTLISIYLATSDEMLPIMLSKQVPFNIISSILLVKFFIALICGIVIDFFISKNKNTNKKIHEICEEEHCDCEHGILKSSLKHSINIIIFLIFVSLCLNTIIYYIGENNLAKLLLKGTLFGPVVTSLFGLIPNCAASVLITELYLANAITFGSMISGLLTGSGVALLVLFKSNSDIKENFKILSILYLIGLFSGLLIDIILFI
ncbi:MAG: putative manganese transporter [Clostridia bacterium]